MIDRAWGLRQLFVPGLCLVARAMKRYCWRSATIKAEVVAEPVGVSGGFGWWCREPHRCGVALVRAHRATVALVVVDRPAESPLFITVWTRGSWQFARFCWFTRTRLARGTAQAYRRYIQAHRRHTAQAHTAHTAQATAPNTHNRHTPGCTRLTPISIQAFIAYTPIPIHSSTPPNHPNYTTPIHVHVPTESRTHLSSSTTHTSTVPIKNPRS